ncbi:MAG: hypothetical protein GY706_01990 [Bacteroides sp.]|nr:hypothetical protein [Bacteroides sp.]
MGKMGVVSGLLFPKLVISSFSAYAAAFHSESKLFFYFFDKVFTANGHTLGPLAFTGLPLFSQQGRGSGRSNILQYL